MAFCKFCGKKLENGEKCGCQATKKSTSKKSEGFDFGKTMTGIKDDLLESLKNPIDVINDNVDAEDMPKTYIMAALIALAFGIFFAGLMKKLFGIIIGMVLGAAGSFGFDTDGLDEMIKLPYAKIIFWGFILFAIILLAYAVVILLIPSIFKNKKIDFKKALVLTTAAYTPMVWAGVLAGILGLLGLDVRIVLAVYVIANTVVSYNFAYAYAKYTDVKPNRFGYVIATIVVLASLISGIATYVLRNAITDSIVGDMTKIDDKLDF